MAERIRVPVRLAVFVDGEQVLERSLEPGGIFNDGSSVAVETIPVTEGDHTVSVRIGDGPDVSAWNFETRQQVRFETGKRRVVVFDATDGFRWH